mgnify:FL=1
MAVGVIKRLVSEKGFGFIRSVIGGDELFFHRSDVRSGTYEDLNKGDRVTYEETRTDKGLRAENVRPE